MSREGQVQMQMEQQQQQEKQGQGNGRQGVEGMEVRAVVPTFSGRQAAHR